jgi:hypothetical protein
LKLPESVKAITLIYQRQKYEEKYTAAKERGTTLFRQWGASPKAATDRTNNLIKGVGRRLPAEERVPYIHYLLDRAEPKRMTGAQKLAWVDVQIAMLFNPKEFPRPRYEHPRRRQASQEHRANIVRVVTRLRKASKAQIMAAIGRTTGGAHYHLKALITGENSPLVRSGYGKYSLRKPGAAAPTHKFDTQIVRDALADGPATIPQMVEKTGIEITRIRAAVGHLSSREGEITVQRRGHVRTYAMAQNHRSPNEVEF